ncbi:uncharacterized protein LOC132034136 [Lycium ferocissimum]|uniref:uncharacterized protein LOC132034136 n=1 Tax=Lycium ferocissimum TaxID=112874 RepID=UPI00281654AC|nr:uncharacterized protein LOC132034136 [Lycium ferocissimum]
MNDNTCLCYFHPKEVVIGVCALCLNERLLILASKQEKKKKINIINLQGKRDYRSFLREKKKKININDDEEEHNHHHSRIHYLPKMFALSSLFNRLDIRHSRKESIHDNGDIDVSSTCSYEDSFISIKFENNGVGSWEKGAVGTVPKVSLKHCDNMSWTKGSNKGAVIEHVAKPRMQLRWRKRIGHIFHLIRLKRSSTKGGASHVCHVSTKLDGVKVRHGHGWIRTLTKRRTKE